MDPDPAIFIIEPSRCQQKTNLLTQFFSAYYFLKVHLHHISKIKSQKESPNSRNQGFFYYFCMMIEGSGSIPLTSGSGSERPKNMWIRWIRIRNTDTKYQVSVIDKKNFRKNQKQNDFTKLPIREGQVWSRHSVWDTIKRPVFIHEAFF